MHKGYRGIWRKVCYVHPTGRMVTEVAVTNAGYLREWIIPWDQSDADPQRFFEQTVDIMIEAYEQYGDKMPVLFDHDVNWKGEPCDFRVEGES